MQVLADRPTSCREEKGREMSQCLHSPINENYLWHLSATAVPHTSQLHTVLLLTVCVVVLTEESPVWHGRCQVGKTAARLYFSSISSRAA